MPQRDAPSDSRSSASVATRFFPVSAALRPYVSTIYLTEISVPRGGRVEDYLHPEWANLRFVEGDPPLAAIGADAVLEAPRFIATGPTSKACYFSARNMRTWGIGILPMGWAKFIPLPADDLADRFADGKTHPAFVRFAPLAHALRRANDIDAAAASINDHLSRLLPDAPPDDPAILAAHVALVDDDLASVAGLADKLSMSERSVERLSHRAFGFPPKLLLRRQRFLRSLGRFMLDPSMAWIDTMDHHYYDQAQFTRDFQRFMGMSPRDYAARPKPILGSAAFARAAAAGAAVQGLHRPAG
ncbi:AraC family transcriptional regulator [Sphingopyxis sp. JAI128]|uniref:helix-turn-helix domain-containing protein n=1 Tax=Sphingopyxis sp. JAI128 TaxID=2723066 RepID=UPI0016218C47|nr:helix-turn-helix domain-containing protein [Sphingopyxis sp. JAI128]MBB6426452.1 AraC-like DNA-binding protein [Sphingopyxis sp. JAI128]